MLKQLSASIEQLAYDCQNAADAVVRAPRLRSLLGFTGEAAFWTAALVAGNLLATYKDVNGQLLA